MKQSTCPCGGIVEWKREKVVIKGKDFGELEVGKCRKCRLRYLHNKTMDMIEHKLGLKEDKSSVYTW